MLEYCIGRIKPNNFREYLSLAGGKRVYSPLNEIVNNQHYNIVIKFETIESAQRFIDTNTPQYCTPDSMVFEFIPILGDDGKIRRAEMRQVKSSCTV